ncbi:glycosyltransferase family 2 protein [Cellulomonas sp. URHE0023]|uniref:glycosyltransferase family 2 protein n=1 Tax=Cellulomonas sp. URHE0023 TaxID=1380354 RepID=UPI00048394DF|nr:glycosyltransferase [Cellulomonas sp. URHE0023]
MSAVVVAMLTYRRPRDLAVAVPAFLAEARLHGGSVLIVDNDPDASARDYVTGLGEPDVRYVHEPRPGIAAGRNRALDEMSDELLVFVDDDERPVDGWLKALLDCRTATGAAVVVGAVVSEFEVPPPDWVVAGGFFDRRRLPTGTSVDVAATNNLLLDMARVGPTGTRFDEAFGLSGGSDTLFSRTLVRHGLAMVWCDEAVVIDMVPATRMTREWVLARARRSGNSASRAELELATSTGTQLGVRGRYVARGLVRIAGGSVRIVLGALRRQDVTQLTGRRNVQRGRGMISGALGHVVYEYKRPSSTAA